MRQEKKSAHFTYGFRLNPRPSLARRFAILCAILSAISIVLSWLAVITIPGGFMGIGAFYFASIFYAIITYWFGGWGLLASFIGAFIGSGLLAGVPPKFAVPFAVANIWEPLIPFLFLRLAPRLGLKIDPLGGNILTKFSYLLLFLIFGAILPPLISGIWGTWILQKASIVPVDEFQSAVYKWWFGAFLLLAIFVPTICKALAGYIRRLDLACHGFFS
jgi:hypothetical protein